VTDNVEKAVRFRAKAPNQEVIQGGASAQIETQKDAPRIPEPVKGSSAQLEDLGGFIWSSSGSQLKDLGGYIWANSEAQLKDLGCPFCSRGWKFSAGQLEDLGPRYAIGYHNNANQLEGLGGFIWNNSDGQLEELGGYIWSNNGSQLKDLGCPYCNRGNVFSAGQLKDLGPFVINSGSQLEALGEVIIFR
jgi:hypothetical protein